MCGITGFLDHPAQSTADEMQSTVLCMATALRHRGPDDSGTWLDPAVGIALGHRRLSVVDLSPLGHQPMHSASGRHVIVFNGEIYNFRALRAELEQRGHAFHGRSDTEVMLAAITEWGVREAVLRFNGMFAFAVWDREGRTLSLARDRFGEKPLYYGWFAGTFMFASELKALRLHPRFRADIDRDALGLYMRYGYVPAPHCIYRHVRKLPAGSVLTLPAEAFDPNARPAPYWSVADAALRSMASPFLGSDEDAAGELENVLTDAVRLRLEADVPLGAFLSGGIDSSTVVAMMQRLTAQPVRTFTVGFEEAPYNEAEQAKEVAKHLGTEHTELYVSSSEAMAVIPRLPTLYDEPFADSSAIPTYLISSLARRFVTVSLSGDGGDELLAGYNRYALGSGSWRWLRRAPRLVRTAIGRGLSAVPPAMWDGMFGSLGSLLPTGAKQRHPGTKLHRLARMLVSDDPHDPYRSVMSHWDDSHAVVLGAARVEGTGAVLPDGMEQLDELHRMMVLDALTYLPDDILVKVDRASMGVSLETRVPFLDHRVAEFCWRLPLGMKIRNGQRKWLLRKVLAKHVPPQLVDRPKTGFVVPIADWLRGPLRSWAEDRLAKPRLHAEGFFEAEQIRPVWARHLLGRQNAHDQLWCVLMFGCWLEEERRPAAAIA